MTAARVALCTVVVMTSALYLDVDGVLNPYQARRPQKHFATYRRHSIGGYRLWLTPEHGPLLAGLGVRIVWATTWVTDRDNLELIAETCGLPYGLSRIVYDPHADGDIRNCGKLPGVIRHAEDHGIERVVWVDDMLGRNDREWVAQEPDKRMCVKPDPGRG